MEEGLRLLFVLGAVGALLAGAVDEPLVAVDPAVAAQPLALGEVAAAAADGAGVGAGEALGGE